MIPTYHACRATPKNNTGVGKYTPPPGQEGKSVDVIRKRKEEKGATRETRRKRQHKGKNEVIKVIKQMQKR
jgi:hypothetical protein